MARTFLSFSLFLLLLAGCGSEDMEGLYGDFEGGKADLLLKTFDPNWLMYDSFFTASDAVDGDTIQAFLEHTPYGNRCFLADSMLDDRRAADIIYEAAQKYQINSILLLARMQVEKVLINSTKKPSATTMAYALGCGAFDDAAWLKGVTGLEKQLQCAAKHLSRNFHNARDLISIWRPGLSRTTEDGYDITPANQATAALYAYTPWVYSPTMKGGNWLVWSVTSKFVEHFRNQGRLDFTDPGWIGAPCVSEDEHACNFQYQHREADCLTMGSARGICSMPCQGICPDLHGVNTFCAEVNGVGACIPKADITNNYCLDLPGTLARIKFRFLGTDGAVPKMEKVCFPVEQQ